MSGYFTNLNYSLANEDSSIERLAIGNFSTALAVAGSGSRAFSLIHRDLKKLIIVDISQPQIEFSQFKWELIQKLSYQNYLMVMGYKTASLSERLKIIDAGKLSSQSKIYADSIPRKCLKQGLIYSGRWESILRRLGRIIVGFTLHRFKKNFEADANREALWPKKRLNFFVRLLGNAKILNTFLYRGQMVKASEQGLENFLLQNFEYTFLNRDPKKSFFHQLLFLGHIEYEQALPIDVTPEVFQQIKNYSGSIEFHVIDLVSSIRTFSFEFGSFSNVPSYFSDEQNKIFEDELARKFIKGLKKVVIRSFLKHRPISHRDLAVKLNVGAGTLAQQQDSTQLYRFQFLENM